MLVHLAKWELGCVDLDNKFLILPNIIYHPIGVDLVEKIQLHFLIFLLFLKSLTASLFEEVVQLHIESQVSKQEMSDSILVIYLLLKILL